MVLQLETSDTRKIPMKTVDGVVFEVDREVAMQMGTLKSFIEDDDGSDPSMIPLPNVYSESLTKIVEYCKAHIEFRKKAEMSEGRSSSEKYGEFTDEAKAFDIEYAGSLSDDSIKDLLLAVNYLNVENLLDFLTQTVADRIKNKSVEHVRRFFGIESDYSPEEEEAIRNECPWAWEDVDED